MAAFIPDTKNEMFQLAIQLVNQSNRNIFLTGKAGTGKTTFLKYIRNNCLKQIAVVAPTGVAAINAGGVTIHSFFQLPLSPFIPISNGTGFQEHQEISNKHSLISRLRFNSDKKKVLQQLELLVIDEISMVRCDTLDAIDTVLRHIRQRPTDRFGGVQVLFIGDMLQLPPVIKEQEWNLLADYYSGHYFFDSKVLQEEPPVCIEFNKIYRQSDQKFIDLLNQVRNNELNEEGVKILESRYQPVFRRKKNDGYIILTTHNNKAAEINAHELKKLNGQLFTYEAEVQDEFSDRAFPAEELLQIKVGAQVMFIRNDAAENGKRYYNGKIGFVSRLEEDKIFVRCQSYGQAGDDGPIEIDVPKEKWENIRYTLNKNTRQLDSDVLGSFTQYPLRLAWAITIHKSQGLTFEKAIIDAGEAFAPGQVYVALSRCTSLEGLVLQSRVRTSSLFTDNRIVEFSQRSSNSHQLQQELAVAKKEFQLFVLLSTFNFFSVLTNSKEIQKYLEEHHSSFNTGSIPWVKELNTKLEQLQETVEKFHQHLQFLFQQAEIPEKNKAITERINAGAAYFTNEIDLLLRIVNQSPVITDSRLHAKEFNDAIREVHADLSAKKFLLEKLPAPFDLEKFYQRKQQFELPFFSVNAYAGTSNNKTDSPHPLLHQQLRKLRESICSKKDLPIYMVAGSNTIDEMARYLPQNLDEFRNITGFGDIKIRQFGQQFLDLILAYSEENHLYSLMHEKSTQTKRKEKVSPAKKKGESMAETFKLFQKGNTIADIARKRNLTTGTIETHLAGYVRTGAIRIEKLLSADKLKSIESALKDSNGISVKTIKQKVGATISFGEIRLALASLKNYTPVDRV